MLDVQNLNHAAEEAEITLDRRSNSERRSPEKAGRPAAVKNERRKVQRRRQIDPTTCERDYSQDEIEFMQAMDQYKRSSGRMFPTCSEILEVVRSLGYVKIGDELSAMEPLETNEEEMDAPLTTNADAECSDDDR